MVKNVKRSLKQTLSSAIINSRTSSEYLIRILIAKVLFRWALLQEESGRNFINKLWEHKKYTVNNKVVTSEY